MIKNKAKVREMSIFSAYLPADEADHKQKFAYTELCGILINLKKSK